MVFSPWNLHNHWSYLFKVHTTATVVFVWLILKCINCNNYLSLFQFLRPSPGLWGLRVDSHTALSWVCLNFISIKWQATSQIMTKKNECILPPSSPSIYPSIHPSPSPSPPPLRTHGCRCADMQPNQSNKRSEITKMNVKLMTGKKKDEEKDKIILKLCSGVIWNIFPYWCVKISRDLCAILGGAAEPGKYAVLMHMHVW